MNILLINQYYAPDVAPTGLYLNDLASELAKRGHQVRVLCSRRSYASGKQYARREIQNGVRIDRLRTFGYGRRRLAGKMLNYASFYVGVVCRLLGSHPKPDLILGLTTPPFLGVAAKSAARLRGIDHAHWLMDLYPNVLLAHGMLRPESLVYRLLKSMSRYSLRGARVVFVLGEDMAEQVAPLTDSPIVNVPLWTPSWVSPDPAGQAAVSLRKARGWTDRQLVLLYSGNMGLGHRFDEFMEAAVYLRPDETVRWVFAGGGKRRSEIEQTRKRYPGARIDVLPYVPEDRIQPHLLSADVHLMSLQPDWRGCMVSSKLQGSFAVGRPVIFVGPDDASPARWIRESGGGWVVPEKHLDDLLKAIDEARDANERTRRGAAARAFAETHFNRQRNVARMCELLEDRN